MGEHLRNRFRSKAPKRMLALDGGGVRGIVSIAFLEEIERTLQKKLGRDDNFVLADYFDMIGGTSVGSMLATLLALGWRVSEIRKRFEKWAPRIFVPSAWGWLSPRFDARRLRGFVQSEVFDWPLKSERLKTGLCVVAKRLDTGSVWVLNNNPDGPFFAGHPAEGNTPARIGNGDYKLVDIIRASTAAPSYFSPTKIRIFAGPEAGLFVDGGVSPHNNPALQMLMLAGVKGYNLNWPLGADNLLLISVGTGSFAHTVDQSGSSAYDAVEALKGLVTDGQDLALKVLQWMSEPRMSWQIDSAVQGLEADCLGREQGLARPLLAFQRYDIRLERDWLSDTLGVTIDDNELARLQDFTNARALSKLYDIASRTARDQVSIADFPDQFGGGVG